MYGRYNACVLRRASRLSSKLPTFMFALSDFMLLTSFVNIPVLVHVENGEFCAPVYGIAP